MAFIVKDTNKAGQMSSSEIENNAIIINSILSGYGWSFNARMAALGNMQWESSLNPGQWEIGYPMNTSAKHGYGLVQWTPSGNYIDWCSRYGYDRLDGELQVEVVDKQSLGTQWIATSKYPISYSEFKVSSETVEYLTYAFCRNYERGSWNSHRLSYAEYWYKFFSGGQVPEKPVDPPEPPPTPPEPGKDKIKGMPIYMYPLYKK